MSGPKPGKPDCSLIDNIEPTAERWLSQTKGQLIRNRFNIMSLSCIEMN